MRNTGIATALALALGLLVGCGQEAPSSKGFELTEQGIKALDRDIAQISITPQLDGQANLVEVRFNRDPLTGGKNDWNRIASDAHQLMRKLLAKPEVSRIRMAFVSPQNNNLDWAHIAVDRKSLPSDWESLSYLEFFAKTDPKPGSIETARWLCEFYGTYRSAQPATGLPPTCKG